VLQHAEKIGSARKACPYFGIGRSSFYRWRDAYQKHGEAGLKNAKSLPKNPANQTPPQIVLSRSMRNTGRQARSTSSITLSKSSRFASVKFGQITATSSKPNSTGMSKTLASATPISNGTRLSSTSKSSAHTDPISKDFNDFSATKVTSISWPNSTNGNGFTIAPDHTVPQRANSLRSSQRQVILTQRVSCRSVQVTISATATGVRQRYRRGTDPCRPWRSGCRPASVGQSKRRLPWTPF